MDALSILPSSVWMPPEMASFGRSNFARQRTRIVVTAVADHARALYMQNNLGLGVVNVASESCSDFQPHLFLFRLFT
jgi:hypothetical protein